MATVISQEMRLGDGNGNDKAAYSDMATDTADGDLIVYALHSIASGGGINYYQTDSGGDTNLTSGPFGTAPTGDADSSIKTDTKGGSLSRHVRDTTGDANNAEPLSKIGWNLTGGAFALLDAHFASWVIRGAAFTSVVDSGSMGFGDGSSTVTFPQTLTIAHGSDLAANEILFVSGWVAEYTGGGAPCTNTAHTITTDSPDLFSDEQAHSWTETFTPSTCSGTSFIGTMSGSGDPDQTVTIDGGSDVVIGGILWAIVALDSDFAAAAALSDHWAWAESSGGTEGNPSSDSWGTLF